MSLTQLPDRVHSPFIATRPSSEIVRLNGQRDEASRRERGTTIDNHVLAEILCPLLVGI